MKFQATIEKIQSLESKILILLKEHAALKRELSASIEENKLLKKEVSRLNDEVKNFQNQDKISKLVSSISDDTQSSSELKLKLNEYIKEIDKCIAHLSE